MNGNNGWALYKDIPLVIDYMYNHYPYPALVGDVKLYPYPKQSFTQYQDGQVICDEHQKSFNSYLIATSGTLTARYYLSNISAFTNTHNFRCLVNPMSLGSLVAYTNARIVVEVTPVRIHPFGPDWTGVHLFARYQTSDTLYVASYRKDGWLTIKKKINGVYTQLASVRHIYQVLTTLNMSFACCGDVLQLSLSHIPVLTCRDSDIPHGTLGIRIDYMDCYIDNIKVTE